MEKYHLHFTDETYEVQRSYLSCPVPKITQFSLPDFYIVIKRPLAWKSLSSFFYIQTKLEGLLYLQETWSWKHNSGYCLVQYGEGLDQVRVRVWMAENFVCYVKDWYPLRYCKQRSNMARFTSYKIFQIFPCMNDRFWVSLASARSTEVREV